MDDDLAAAVRLADLGAEITLCHCDPDGIASEMKPDGSPVTVGWGPLVRA